MSLMQAKYYACLAIEQVIVFCMVAYVLSVSQRLHASQSSRPVRPVQLVQVDVVCAQPFQTAVYSFKDVCSAQGGWAAPDPGHLC